MIYWAPFLHFYQPPTQFHAILKKVSNESYRPLVKVLLEHPQAKVTINICAVLTEMLNDHGQADIVANIKKLAQNNQIEFVDSAKYHAILPLLPVKEMRRQIELNHKTNAYFFQETYKPEGFFPPEMCYSDELATLLSTMAYRWVLVSGIAAPAKWPQEVISKVALGLNGICVFYRDDILSNKISFRNIDSAGFISELLNLEKGSKDKYVITAMDAETFGHHIQNWEELFLAKVLESKQINQIKLVTISELLKKFPVKDAPAPMPSSWSSTKEDIQKKNYYPLWKDKNNPVHPLQWEHLNICFELLEEALKSEAKEESRRFTKIARELLDQAVHSCQFWWANQTRGMWDINMINQGLVLQEEVMLNAYKAITLSDLPEALKKKSYRQVAAARDAANKIRDRLLTM
ncbi:MAG: hypothetical protein JW714_05215 [Candidatus Omnitrophica bacterium]|nr:hypothetical protein [Candidatus Omnitrophota bacterium]